MTSVATLTNFEVQGKKKPEYHHAVVTNYWMIIFFGGGGISLWCFLLKFGYEATNLVASLGEYDFA